MSAPLTVSQMSRLVERVQQALDETYGGLKIRHVEVGRAQFHCMLGEFPSPHVGVDYREMTVRGVKVVRTDAFDEVAFVVGPAPRGRFS